MFSPGRTGARLGGAAFTCITIYTGEIFPTVLR